MSDVSIKKGGKGDGSGTGLKEPTPIPTPTPVPATTPSGGNTKTRVDPGNLWVVSLPAAKAPRVPKAQERIVAPVQRILKTVNQRTVSHQRIRIPAAGISKQSLIQSRKRLHRWIPVRMDIRKLPGRVEPEV